MYCNQPKTKYKTTQIHHTQMAINYLRSKLTWMQRTGAHLHLQLISCCALFLNLTSGFLCSSGQSTALHVAAREGCLAVCELLIAGKADVDAKGRCAFIFNICYFFCVVFCVFEVYFWYFVLVPNTPLFMTLPLMVKRQCASCWLQAKLTWMQRPGAHCCSKFVTDFVLYYSAACHSPASLQRRQDCSHISHHDEQTRRCGVAAQLWRSRIIVVSVFDPAVHSTRLQNDAAAAVADGDAIE